MKKILLLFVSISILFLFFSCARVVPVRIVTNSSDLGGKNVLSMVREFPITYDGKTIKGLPSDGNVSTTAVIFSDEKGQQKISYSGINKVQLGHIQMVKVVDKDYINFAISRIFYDKESAAMRILRPFMTILTLGYWLMVPREIYGNEIQVNGQKDASGKTTYYPAAAGANMKFSQKFINGELMNIVLLVQNTGNTASKKELLVLDVIPDYFKVKSVGYWSNTDVKGVTYDLHKRGSNSILACKIKPGINGLAKSKSVWIKVTVKPDIDRFRSSVYGVK